MRKSQVSVEYLMVIALSFMLLVPGLYLMLEYTRGTTTQIIGYQVDQLGRLFVDGSNTVDGFGKDARLVVEADLPDKVKNISSYGKILTIEIRDGPAKGSTMFVAKVNMTVNLSADDMSVGPKRFRIESQGDYVSIRRV